MSLMRRVWGFLRGRPFQPEAREQREFKRILVRFAIVYAGEHKKGRGIAHDLSLGGCMMETDTPLPADSLLELKLFVAEQEMPIEVAASVRWADGQRMGIKFLRIRDRDRLRKFLSADASPVQYPR
jgi:c-di-GMP-binding flagellar brake protein YcgR